jgi:hypothetical protein
VDDLGSAAIVSIKMATVKEKAPPHWGLLVRQFLDATFPKRWIERDGPIPWPPRSPDITFLDFFFVRIC